MATSTYANGLVVPQADPPAALMAVLTGAAVTVATSAAPLSKCAHLTEEDHLMEKRGCREENEGAEQRACAIIGQKRAKKRHHLPQQPPTRRPEVRGQETK